jgi:site-specific DNA-methyltransferase (adenine-specific)
VKTNQIICGDYKDIVKSISNNSIDLILTDPPYNAKNIGPKNRVYLKGKMQLPPEEYKKFCKHWFKEAQRIVKNDAIVFTPGIANTHNYPQPYWQICWHKPAAVSYNRYGGFNAWEPIFTYGKTKKRIGQDYIKVNTLNFTKGPERNHPCPKSPNLWEWIIRHFSNEGDLVCDFFGGSGTTAKICKELKRRYIVIDIIPEYCKIAKKRLLNTQGRLF